MSVIHIDSLPATARSFKKEKVSFKWSEQEGENLVEMEGDVFFLTEVSYGAGLRLISAKNDGTFYEVLIAERVRFNEDGNGKISADRARVLLESGDPMFAAMMNAVLEKLFGNTKTKGIEPEGTAKKVKH